MKFNEVMELPFIENNVGNATAYIKLSEEIKDVSNWRYSDWIAACCAYYSTVDKPSSAWLHDIYKNRCKYNVKEMYDYLYNLSFNIGSNL